MSINKFDLRGRNALVTGAAGYLGSTIATALAEAGAHVFVNSRDAERCQLLVEELKKKGLSGETAVFDITDELAVGEFFHHLGADNALHIIVNNAYSGGAGQVEFSKGEDYLKSYGIAVVAAHNLLVGGLSAMRSAVRKDGYATVINIASMYAMVSPDQRLYDLPEAVNPPFYGAAKAGLLQWTRYAACEFGPQGIRVNSVSPGPFPSPDVQERNPNFVDRLASRVPLGRVGNAEEIAGPILFLASQASSFVNGSNLVVDGGWTCW